MEFVCLFENKHGFSGMRDSSSYEQLVKVTSLCLINEALRHEDEWGGM
jgi:hypothetical protein